MGELYERISRLCADRGVSGFRMCRDIGMQPSIMTDLKMGRTKGLSAKNLQKVAGYFGVTVEYILTGKKEKPAAKSDGPSVELTEKQEEIRRLLAQLPDQEAEMILRQIQGLIHNP